MNCKAMLVVPLLSGCAASPYVDVGVGYSIDNHSDWYLRTDRTWTCDSAATAHFEVGLEWDYNVTLGYHHQSHWSCGGPFNRKPELYQDEVILTKRFGGKP